MSRTSYKYDVKKRTNLTVSEPLLDQAKDYGINLSAAAERGIEAAVAEAKKRQWLEENKEAIKSSNDYVTSHGLPLVKNRLF